MLLAPNLRPKVVPHDGSRLLLGLIVRARRRLVAPASPTHYPQETRSPAVALSKRSIDARHTRPVATFPQREGLLALRLLLPALLLPALCSQSQLNRRIRALHNELRALQQDLAQGLCETSAVNRVMDTTLLPAIVRVRASRKGLFAGQASFGRSASKTEWVYGFKVALVVDPEGIITAFFLAPAASEERPIGEALDSSDHHGAYLADKGFAGVGTALDGALWSARCGHTEGNSRRAWSKADRRWASGKRQIIEGVIYQLKDFFSLERHRAKTVQGLLARLAAKVAAYTCAQRINDSLGRPMRHLVDLLI
jgi:hypothetical protein